MHTCIVKAYILLQSKKPHYKPQYIYRSTLDITTLTCTLTLILRKKKYPTEHASLFLKLLPPLGKTSLRAYKTMYSNISEHSSTSEHHTAMKYYWQSLYSMIGKKRESIYIVIKIFRKECPHFARSESLSLSEESSSVSAVSGMSSPLSCFSSLLLSPDDGVLAGRGGRHA